MNFCLLEPAESLSSENLENIESSLVIFLEGENNHKNVIATARQIGRQINGFKIIVIDISCVEIAGDIRLALREEQQKRNVLFESDIVIAEKISEQKDLVHINDARTAELIRELYAQRARQIEVSRLS